MISTPLTRHRGGQLVLVPDQSFGGCEIPRVTHALPCKHIQKYFLSTVLQCRRNSICMAMKNNKTSGFLRDGESKK